MAERDATRYNLRVMAELNIQTEIETDDEETAASPTVAPTTKKKKKEKRRREIQSLRTPQTHPLAVKPILRSYKQFERVVRIRTTSAFE